ncbi:MAG TPA: hypothetical protein VF797_19420 [Noviherbaspirillum sp.]
MDLIDVLTGVGAILAVVAALCNPLPKDDADNGDGKGTRDNAQ